jgi:16S rRNA (guanine966-N2)-methyltransferase
VKVRLIAGQYGGRIIAAPDSQRTHPMSERVRGALFNIMASELEGADVLDVFAGTGALGLEALSRGASHAVFVERDKLAQKILQENITTLNIGDRAKLVKTTVSNWLETTEEKTFDVIFADPPYHDPQFSTIHKLFGLLKPGGYMVLSHPGRGEVPIQTGIVVVDNRSYGNAYLTFFRRDA